MKTKYKKNTQGKLLNYLLCTISYNKNSLGNPPNIQLIGRITKYAPVRELDAIIISFVYLKDNNPNGIVNNISKITSDHTEYTSNIALNREFTSIPIIKPKT